MKWYIMQQLAGALGYINGSSSMSAQHRSAPTVLVSQPSVELADRMYADLVDSLRHSREVAERHAAECEKRAQIAEERLHELKLKLQIGEKEDV